MTRQYSGIVCNDNEGFTIHRTMHSMPDTDAIAAQTDPRTIPRAEHSISRRNISKSALRVLYRLHENGYRACLVGGAVRDLLLDKHPKDFDVATDATPEQVRDLFRNCRLIGRRFRLAHVVFGREVIEVATFRGEGEGGNSGARRLEKGRLVRDNVWGSIEEDAVRRDFRVNALYYDIADFSVIDFVGGMQDLKDGVLRLIGDPERRYREDPVRMLRAARLSAKLGFEIDAAAEEPIFELSGLLADTAPARLFDESLKLFMTGHAAASFRTLEHLDLLGRLFPAAVRHLTSSDTQLRGMLEQALANTDARVNDGRRVTPAFLLAVFLWPAVRQRVDELLADGVETPAAWQRGAHEVVAEQTTHAAIPRRFTATMEEIWELQPRFARGGRKRVFRLLEHRRFRAAYDFLLLRADESDAVKQLGEWWTQAQQASSEDLAAQLGGKPEARADSGKSGGGNRRRGRRGGRRRRQRGSRSDD